MAGADDPVAGIVPRLRLVAAPDGVGHGVRQAGQKARAVLQVDVLAGHAALAIGCRWLGAPDRLPVRQSDITVKICINCSFNISIAHM